jgi:hypothetical protein
LLPLEGDSSVLVGKLNYNINGPGAMLGCVDAAAGVVIGMSCRHVSGDARVVLRRTLVIPEDVDETFRHTLT